MNKDNKEAGKTKFESVDMLPIDVPAFLFPCKQIIEIIQKKCHRKLQSGFYTEPFAFA